MIFLYYLFNVRILSSVGSTFISDISILCFLVNLAKIYQFCWSRQRTHFCFNWFLIFNFIDFCSSFYYFLLSLDLICSFLVSWKLRLLIFRSLSFSNECIQRCKFPSNHCFCWITQLLISCIFIRSSTLKFLWDSFDPCVV